jgi:citronellol/citronellal dehydrogenase
VLNLAPPLSFEARWFKNHVAYSMAKFGMSLCVLGMAEEFRGRVAFNALWPRTAIDTAAMEMLAGPAARQVCRRPEIMADAAHVILTKDARSFTGRFLVDDEVLREAGVTDLSVYLHEGQRESDLMPDFFV